MSDKKEPPKVDTSKDRNINDATSFFDSPVETEIQTDLNILLGKPMIITNVHFRKGETNTYAIIIYREIGNTELKSTTCGGGVVVDKLAQLKEKKRFPVKANIDMVKGRNREYYDFI